MRVITSAFAFADALETERALGRRVGLVPTMGALHAGHRSLVERAAAECDVVAVTVFVNPLQFSDASDLELYPRDLDGDAALAAAAGAQLVFAPSVAEMYPGFPAPVATSVRVSGVSEGLEGASRPGHFDGVATVVAKLFSLAGPCRAYFGEKDFQQLAVVRRMVADLSIPVSVVGCPTVREPDGLALSSRNARLSAPARQAAPALRRALDAGLASLSAGVRDRAAVESAMARCMDGHPLVEPDYAVAVDSATLSAPEGAAEGECELVGEVRLLVAAVVGGVRLIDNDGATLDAPGAADAPARGVRVGRLVGAIGQPEGELVGASSNGEER